SPPSLSPVTAPCSDTCAVDDLEGGAHMSVALARFLATHGIERTRSTRYTRSKRLPAGDLSMRIAPIPIVTLVVLLAPPLMAQPRPQRAEVEINEAPRSKGERINQKF